MSVCRQGGGTHDVTLVEKFLLEMLAVNKSFSCFHVRYIMALTNKHLDWNVHCFFGNYITPRCGTKNVQCNYQAPDKVTDIQSDLLIPWCTYPDMNKTLAP